MLHHLPDLPGALPPRYPHHGTADPHYESCSTQGKSSTVSAAGGRADDKDRMGVDGPALLGCEGTTPKRLDSDEVEIIAGNQFSPDPLRILTDLDRKLLGRGSEDTVEKLAALVVVHEVGIRDRRVSAASRQYDELHKAILLFHERKRAKE